MAGKTNTSATYFAQKKLLGKAHTSNLKIDGEETIGSNIQIASSLVFGETIPASPTRTLNTVQGSVEYIEFVLEALTGTTYDANDEGGGSGDDTDENLQTAGPHAYKFKFPSNYETITGNPDAGSNGFFNDALVHESLGTVQLVPPYFSQDAPNPYIVKLYKDDGSGNAGDEIPLLDNIDWNVDYYNGILFLQDYDSQKIPAFARAFSYVGKMLNTVIAESGGGGGGTGDGDSQAEYVILSATGSLPNAKVLQAGSNITIVEGSGTVTISSTGTSVPTVSGREKESYFVTASHPAGNSFDVIYTDFSKVLYDENKIDVFYNGTFLHSGTVAEVVSNERDYYIPTSGSIVFGFGLFDEDIVDTVISVVGNTQESDKADKYASYLVLNATSSLDNERVIDIGSGLQFTDNGPGGNFTIEIEKEMVFNDLLSGDSDGENTLFTLSNVPFANNQISVFVNGVLQVPPDLLEYQDYSVTGSEVYFTTGSTPPQGSWVMANYYIGA